MLDTVDGAFIVISSHPTFHPKFPFWASKILGNSIKVRVQYF